MIKVSFSDMKTGVIVSIQVEDPTDLKAHLLALEERDIRPIGCHSCKTEHGSPDRELPYLGDSYSGPGPGQLPENWNPDDFPPTG